MLVEGRWWKGDKTQVRQRIPEASPVVRTRVGSQSGPAPHAQTTRARWAGSHLESFVARSAREESDLGAQAMCKLAMGGQRGIWMGAAKAEEARRRVRTSAVAPPCVRLEGGAAIIRGSVRP